VSPPNDDRGWHIDASTPRADGSRAVSGRPHTVLLLTLLSDVGPKDAPTRIRAGSHRDVARTLGQDMLEAGCPVVYPTGKAGDINVVHPFTVHAADQHRGATPRFLAQSPLMLTTPLGPTTSSPLARAFE
jgi:hypothetical protein